MVIIKLLYIMQKYIIKILTYIGKRYIFKIDIIVFLLLKSKEALNYEEIRKCYFND